MTRQAERELQRGLDRGRRSLVEQHRAPRERTFAAHGAPRRRPAASSRPRSRRNDPPTVQPLADDYRRQLGADLLLVITDRGGARWLGRRRRRRRRPATLAVDGTPRDGAESGRAFWPHPRGILQLVTVPIIDRPRAPRRARHAERGLPRSTTALAAQFKALTGSDVAFGMDGERARLDAAGRRAPR